MRFDDCPRSPRMRLIRFRLVKRRLHRSFKLRIAAASSNALFNRAPSDRDPNGIRNRFQHFVNSRDFDGNLRQSARWVYFRRINGLHESRRITQLHCPILSENIANAELFQARVLEAVANSPIPVRRVVVTAEPVTSGDVTSADMLAELEQTLRASRIELQFAEAKDPVKDKLKRFGLLGQIGTDAFHPTIGAAVDAYLAEHAVDWKP
jgi:STAS domain